MSTRAWKYKPARLLIRVSRAGEELLVDVAGRHGVVGGPTGVGKAWLACGLGHKAYRDGFAVIYRQAPLLFSEPATARVQGGLTQPMTTLQRAGLLIIDDWGPEL